MSAGSVWPSIARVGPPLSAVLGLAALGVQAGPGATVWVVAVAAVSGVFLPERSLRTLSAWLVFNVLATPPFVAALTGVPLPPWPSHARYLLGACIGVAVLALVGQGRVWRG